MKQLKYQQKAVKELVEKSLHLLTLPGTRKQLIFKAPTGAGKTVMASELLATLTEELQSRSDLPFQQVAFVWIAPNKLHQQSYFKMKNFFTESNLLRPVMYDELDQSDGVIRPGEVLFVNWESVNSEKNLMVRDNEQGRSLYDITRRTQQEQGTPIVVVIDEEHLFWSKTADKSKKVLEKIAAKVEIRISATPKTVSDYQVTIDRQEVIQEEMIKEGVLLNPDVTADYTTDEELNQHLIKIALQKRNQLAEAYRQEGVNINPLLLIQLPNDKQEPLTAEDTKIMHQVKDYLHLMCGITTDNHRLAIWLSKEKVNVDDGLEQNDNLTEVLLFKQAIALGWDCPRAAVLLIFRRLTSDEFTVQIVGRILRMPEQKFYRHSLLNKGYVYTDISKDRIRIAADDMDYLHKSMLQAVRRENLHNVQLTSSYEVRRSADRNRLGPDFRRVLNKMFEELWLVNPQYPFQFLEEDAEGPQEEGGEESVVAKNCKAAEKLHIRLDVKHVNIEIPADLFFRNEENELIEVGEKAKFTRTANEVERVYVDWCRSLLVGFEKAHSTGVLANYLLEAMETLFELFETEARKVILYHENKPKFAEVVTKALNRYAKQLAAKQQQARNRGFEQYAWEVPAERLYTEEHHYVKSVVREHALLPFIELVTASSCERQFTQFLEQHAGAIDWWYKNGDAGRQHYAVPYVNSQGNKALFYVDFVIRMRNGQLFLFDTKSEGSDPEAMNKHNALLEYMQSAENAPKRLKGGVIVRDSNGSGNWLYSPLPIENTSDVKGWDAFHPDQYQEESRGIDSL